MSIDNPNTFGEAYWGLSVDASKAFADAEEKSLSPLLQSLAAMFTDLEGFPAPIAALFNAVGTPGHFGLAEVAKGVLGEGGNASLGAGLSPFLRALGYAANKKFPSANIKFDTAIALAQRKRIIPELFNSRALDEGFKEAEARLNYEAAMPYPSITDLINWARYTTNDTSTKEKVWSKFDVLDDDWPVWQWLSEQKLSSDDVKSLFIRQAIDRTSAVQELVRQGWTDDNISQQLELAYSLPAPTALIQAGLMHDKSWESIMQDITLAGVHPDYASDYMHAVLSKPNPEDVIRWRLRTDPDLSDITRDLTRLGIHPDYLDVYRSLAYPVPPVGDMITMAVREAFTPDIAARFGQYEDYPQELTRFAAMNGVSEEWAQRYWAAHWSLPSPQQGFEMFHRGIIDREELALLMRALDIMPYWRDRLIQISYNPLTRIDVKRMYQLGVLSEGEIERAYRDVGYDDTNARRLADYVVRDTLRSQSGMSVGKIITAYKNGYTTRAEANNAILDMGILQQNASAIMESADRQLVWQRTKDGIAAIRNQYKQGLYTPTEAKQHLTELRLDAVKTESLLNQWEKEAGQEHANLWTKADTLGLLKRKIVTEARARQELSALGYNDERIKALIANATYTKPA